MRRSLAFLSIAVFAAFTATFAASGMALAHGWAHHEEHESSRHEEHAASHHEASLAHHAEFGYASLEVGEHPHPTVGSALLTKVVVELSPIAPVAAIEVVEVDTGSQPTPNNPARERPPTSAHAPPPSLRAPPVELG